MSVCVPVCNMCISGPDGSTMFSPTRQNIPFSYVTIMMPIVFIISCVYGNIEMKMPSKNHLPMCYVSNGN